jgi:hypothetical protein
MLLSFQYKLNRQLTGEPSRRDAACSGFSRFRVAHTFAETLPPRQRNLIFISQMIGGMGQGLGQAFGQFSIKDSTRARSGIRSGFGQFFIKDSTRARSGIRSGFRSVLHKGFYKG